MISRSIRNRVDTLRELVRAGHLNEDKLEIALAGFIADAERVALIEQSPVPVARRHAGNAGVADFVAHKAVRDMQDWLADKGIEAAVTPVPPPGPGDAA